MLQAAVAAALLCTGSAQAVILDFDETNVTNQLSYSNLFASYLGSTYTEDGFVFSSSGWIEGLHSLAAPAATYNNHSYAFGESLGGTTTLSTADNSLFSISSLNLFRSPWIWNTTVTFVGTKADTTTVSQNFTFTNNNWNTLTFGAGFTNLASLQWTQTSIYVVDNLNVTAVPEPETYAMLLAGLGLLGWARRRQQA